MDKDTTSNLYSWFESSGIISNVRTHLRQNLINALKNRDLDLKRDSAPKSAKQYVHDMLIAEYLFSHNYAYTLSVFASEAPMLVTFPSNPRSAQAAQNKLQQDYVLHVLQTLAIDPTSTKGRYILEQYVRGDTPLLLCVLKSLSLSFAIQTCDDKHVCDQFVQTDSPRLFFEEEEAKLAASKKRIIHQKKILDRELRTREAALKEQAIVVNRQLELLTDKFEQLRVVMTAITLKERESNEQRANEEGALEEQLELTRKEKQILVDANRKFQEDLATLQDQLSRVRKEVAVKKVAIVRTAQVQTQDTVDVEKDGQIESLTREKEQLNAAVKEQQFRIEQITQRALQLSRQVQDMQLLRPINDETTQTPAKTANTILSETSSTEDILQDAKSRLRRLQEESLKADQYYYKFINATS